MSGKLHDAVGQPVDRGPDFTFDLVSHLKDTHGEVFTDADFLVGNRPKSKADVWAECLELHRRLHLR